MSRGTDPGGPTIGRGADRGTLAMHYGELHSGGSR